MASETTAAIVRNRGQVAFRSRASSRRMSSAGSVVQRLALREVSGQSLNLSVHQHFGFRLHCEWTGAFGNRSFERRFRTYEAVLEFCTRINTRTLEVVCTCITLQDTFFDGFQLMHDKVSICRALLPPLRRRDESWSCTQRERNWQEGDADHLSPSCGAQSMECIVQ
jgi:hypothetical protein